jgi:hypothetical protein
MLFFLHPAMYCVSYVFTMYYVPYNQILYSSLAEKRLSMAYQNCLSLAHFGSPVTYMPAVMLTDGEYSSSPGIKKITAGAFGICAGDNILSLAN